MHVVQVQRLQNGTTCGCACDPATALTSFQPEQSTAAPTTPTLPVPAPNQHSGCIIWPQLHPVRLERRGCSGAQLRPAGCDSASRSPHSQSRPRGQVSASLARQWMCCRAWLPRPSATPTSDRTLFRHRPEIHSPTCQLQLQSACVCMYMLQERVCAVTTKEYQPLLSEAQPQLNLQQPHGAHCSTVLCLTAPPVSGLPPCCLGQQLLLHSTHC